MEVGVGVGERVTWEDISKGEIFIREENFP